MEKSGWFGVRCVFRFDGDGDGDPIYEERITVWRAQSSDEAIASAESEAADYVQDTDGEYLGLAQAYTMADELGEGAEVFSLMRTSELDAAEYLDTYFDTGSERATSAGPS